MEINLSSLYTNQSDNNIDNFNIEIPFNRIIGLYGNMKDEFIDRFINSDFDNLDKDNNHYLNQIILLDNYNSFITNNVKDELYLSIKDYIIKEKDIIKVLRYFNLNEQYLNRDIYTLSSTEKKIIKLIIIAFNSYKTVIIKRLFNGLDYNYIKLFKKFIKIINKDYHKLVFVNEDNINLMYSFVERIMIVDSNLLIIDTRKKVLENANIDKVSDISKPKVLLFQELLETKGIKIKNCYSVRDLIREVKNNV